MIFPVLFQLLLISFESLAVIAFHHSLEGWRCMSKNIGSRLIHCQVGRHSPFRERLVIRRYPWVTERKESPMCIGSILRVIRSVAFITPDSVTTLGAPNQTGASNSSEGELTFSHMELLPGHRLKSLALSLLEKNFSSTHDPAGCCRSTVSFFVLGVMEEDEDLQAPRCLSFHHSRRPS